LIYERARTVLDAVVTGFAVDGVALPERQYVANGAVAADCEQLVVQVARIFRGLPGGTEGGTSPCHGPVSMDVDVHLLRCVPTIEGEGEDVSLPSAVELEASGEELLRDAEILRRSIKPLVDCRSIVLGNLVPYGPEGGLGGWTYRLVVQI